MRGSPIILGDMAKEFTTVCVFMPLDLDLFAVSDHLIPMSQTPRKRAPLHLFHYA